MLLTSMLASLRRLRRSPRQAAALGVSAFAAALLLRFARSQRAAYLAVRLVPISEVLRAIERGMAQSAVVAVGACAVRLTSGEACRAILLPTDAKLLSKLLHRHGVPYQAQGPVCCQWPEKTAQRSRPTAWRHPTPPVTLQLRHPTPPLSPCSYATPHLLSLCSYATPRLLCHLAARCTPRLL